MSYLLGTGREETNKSIIPDVRGVRSLINGIQKVNREFQNHYHERQRQGKRKGHTGRMESPILDEMVRESFSSKRTLAVT